MAGKKRDATQITFFRQSRVDGGIRTGIDIDDIAVWRQFAPGAKEFDNAVLWFVDLRCKGRKLPRDLEGARTWLLQQASVIKEGLQTLAEELPAGIDSDVWPLQRKVPVPPDGVDMEIVVSAMRRVTGRDIASVLRDIGSRWEELVQNLEPVNV